MCLVGLGRQSAIDLALDEWAAVAEARVNIELGDHDGEE